ncbi:MAG: STAS domain-containing protein [Brevundimonas sp.]|uniref:STAS domain-containing protein n=1 Tax=Brevundimonas sp. TaxID=1871086 RepID=UPI00258BE0C6|nr:STAS domain-containing protein [Brevundimonas sp.]MCV0415630.1 STAS domain-containing protein [Brevundimonas sp.]
MRMVTLESAPVVKNVAALRQSILEAFEEDDEIAIHIPDVYVADLCGLQLIESARRHAAAVGKTLVLDRPAGGFRDILEAAGFLTDASPETLRFWLHEGPAQ